MSCYRVSYHKWRACQVRASVRRLRTGLRGRCQETRRLRCATRPCSRRTACAGRASARTPRCGCPWLWRVPDTHRRGLPDPLLCVRHRCFRPAGYSRGARECLPVPDQDGVTGPRCRRCRGRLCRAPRCRATRSHSDRRLRNGCRSPCRRAAAHSQSPAWRTTRRST